MSRAILYSGDVRAVLAGLPPESVQMVCTSPPYWGLRDYGVSGQLGLERTPEEYVANMVAVFREVRRVLRPDGVCWLNLGDSYAGSWGNQGRKPERGTQRPINGGMLTPVHDGRYPSNGSNTGVCPPGLKPKDLCGIPWRVAFALQADGWWLRSDVIWAKPNPMPESVTDRPTRSHEYLFLLTKSERYWYDAQAIAEPAAPWNSAKGFNKDGQALRNIEGRIGARDDKEQSGRNARSVWTIATMPYPQAHFATFPEELARRCILAGSSPRACEHCGAPWERVTERPDFSEQPKRHTSKDAHLRNGDRTSAGQAWQAWRNANPDKHLGWQPTCSCENAGTGRCVVLDPFGGSGTVAQVATGNGRDSIYIDLNPKYLELAKQRIGPMFCYAA